LGTLSFRHPDLLIGQRSSRRGWLGCTIGAAMRKTLEALNALEVEGVIRRYAIGGAAAAVFYMEPFLTYDLDVFVSLPADQGGIVSLAPIYQAARKLGFGEEGEHIIVEGVPVQFLPAYNALLKEALDQAREISYEVTVTRVFRPEHLMAIMLQTGRDKDRQRLEAFRRQATWDAAYFDGILIRHGLLERWMEWIR